MKLIFIYNATSGKLNTMLDSVHKIVSPSTYDCNLCSITFGIINEDSLWKTFREHTDHEMIFLHKDEYEINYRTDKIGATLPSVLIENNNALDVFISAEEINNMNTSEELIEIIKKRSTLY